MSGMWTRETPTEPGVYWYTEGDMPPLGTIEVRWFCGTLMAASWRGWVSVASLGYKWSKEYPEIEARAAFDAMSADIAKEKSRSDPARA